MAEPNQALTQSKRGYVYGDVDIAPGVAMAEGVLLGAEPGCRLVISAGVCLGADVVIRVSRGTLVIEPGANLGSGVLVVGPGRIGHHACIGANSTVINPNVEAHGVVAPKLLLGDPTQQRAVPAQGTGFTSREPGSFSNGGTASGQAEFAPVPAVEEMPAVEETPSNGGLAVSRNGGQPAAEESPATEPLSATEGQSNEAVPSKAEGNQANGSTPTAPAESAETEEPAEGKSLANVTHVYGKKQVSQLLETLFPHRRPLNGSTSEDKT